MTIKNIDYGALTTLYYRYISNNPISPLAPRRNGLCFVPIFYCIKNQSHAPSFLLFRKRSRQVAWLVCKRTRCRFVAYQPFSGAPKLFGFFMFKWLKTAVLSHFKTSFLFPFFNGQVFHIFNFYFFNLILFNPIKKRFSFIKHLKQI